MTQGELLAEILDLANRAETSGFEQTSANLILIGLAAGIGDEAEKEFHMRIASPSQWSKVYEWPENIA